MALPSDYQLLAHAACRSAAGGFFEFFLGLSAFEAAAYKQFVPFYSLQGQASRMASMVTLLKLSSFLSG